MKAFAMTLVALILFPALIIAAELKGTVANVDKAKSQLVLVTNRGEMTIQISENTKGIEHAKHGAKVTVQLSEKDGMLKVNQIQADK